MPAQADLLLAIAPGIGCEGFQIDGPAAGPVCITGHDARGVLYGVGKFLHTSTCTPGCFTPSAWRGVSVPQRTVRAMYFASHFFNFYHSAPIAEVERYVEELALWGCNTLSVWFDMHHYQGIRHPEAQAMIARLRAILQAGNRVGMGASLTAVANEGYADSPEELRADWEDGQNGYHAGRRGIIIARFARPDRAGWSISCARAARCSRHSAISTFATTGSGRTIRAAAPARSARRGGPTASCARRRRWRR